MIDEWWPSGKPLGVARKEYVGPQGERVSSNGSTAGDSFVALYAKVCAEDREQERQWIASLRLQGVKAAHPDDGWIDRKKSLLHFAYPQFNDGAAPGDLVALGWAEKWRIVKLLGVKDGLFGFRQYRFEEVASE